MNPILVTGGTGTLGRVVVDRLRNAGREVRIASRREQPSGPAKSYTVDYDTGAGLDAAVAGTSAIVHCASAARGDLAVTKKVIEAARAEDVHFVYISIVGAERVPFGYYRTKLAAEKVIENSGLPWTILRTTQFHNLVHSILDFSAKSPLMPVLAGSFQPIGVGEVADRLAELAMQPAAGRVPDMAGPEVRTLIDMAHVYLKSSGRHRVIVPVWLPGAAFRAFRNGGLVEPDRAVGRLTFEDFLSERAATAGKH